MNSSHQYNKNSPFLASVKERIFLGKPGSQKRTYHLVLDLKNSGLTYEVGDSVGIFSQHDPDLIQKTLDVLRMTGDEKIIPKGTEEFIELKKYFKDKVSLSEVPQLLLKAVFDRQTVPSKKQSLGELLQPDRYADLKSYLAEHEVWDFLLAHEEVSFTPQEIVDLLMPLLPRFYSIASSQKYVGEEVHLTVALKEYESRGHKRRGVCTHFLCMLSELQKPTIPLFIQPSPGFRLPAEHTKDIIMIGPGTGIAPFRAFMQERGYHQATGKHWVFFGECNRASDFFYEKEWAHWQSECTLRIDAAFSRDQEHKVYVQHKMLENGAELFRWLEGGASLFVCGDASRMAKDVEAALINIIQEHSQCDLSGARAYIKRLRQEKRYLRDVY